MIRTRGTWAIALASLLAACSKGGAKPSVASGDGVTVTVEEFKAKLDEQSPFIRARYATLEHKKEFLENLIRFELLAHEAEKQKLDKDSEVQATLKKLMVQKLVRRAFDEKDRAQASEVDARKYYDEHRDEFVKPERVRLSQIFLKAEKGVSDRTARAGEARKVFARLKGDEPKNPLAFANIARELSEDLGSKAGGGDLGFRAREELEKQWGKEVADAAFSIKESGQTSGIVDGSHGFHVLKLISRQPAVDRSFDDVKAQLAARAGRERRTREFDEYVKKLRDSASIKIDEAELEKVAITSAPVTAPGVPPVAPPAPPPASGAER